MVTIEVEVVGPIYGSRVGQQGVLERALPDCVTDNVKVTWEERHASQREVKGDKQFCPGFCMLWVEDNHKEGEYGW